MDINEENRWAVYPIEKLEAAMKNLSDAIAEARSRARIERRDEHELDKLMCPGCYSNLYLTGNTHIWADNEGMEPCLATEERKRRLREYFAGEKA